MWKLLSTSVSTLVLAQCEPADEYTGCHISSEGTMDRLVVGGQLLFALGYGLEACVWLSPGSRRKAPLLEHGCPRLQHPYQSDESMGAPGLPHWLTRH